MASTNEGCFDRLLLEQFPFSRSRIKFEGYLGHGSAGFVFKVRVNSQIYALKLASQSSDKHVLRTANCSSSFQFKFYYPELHPTYKLQGTIKKAYYDSFLVECRANHSLIDQHINGKHTPFCYGWTRVNARVEDHVARLYNVQKFLWDRPPGSGDALVRGILYEYIESEKTLFNTRITSEIANSARSALRGLHDASLAHGDIRASNILINQNERARWIDLSTSISLPHINMSESELREIQKDECLQLEIGFAFLLKVRE